MTEGLNTFKPLETLLIPNIFLSVKIDNNENNSGADRIVIPLSSRSYLQSSALLVERLRTMTSVVTSRAGEKEEQQSQERNIAAGASSLQLS